MKNAVSKKLKELLRNMKDYAVQEVDKLKSIFLLSKSIRCLSMDGFFLSS